MLVGIIGPETIVPGATAHEPSHGVNRVVEHGRDSVSVHIHREGDGRMSEDLRHDLRRDASRKGVGSPRVPEIVESNAWKLRCMRNVAEANAQGSPVQGTAVETTEDQVLPAGINRVPERPLSLPINPPAPKAAYQLPGGGFNLYEAG